MIDPVSLGPCREVEAVREAHWRITCKWKADRLVEAGSRPEHERGDGTRSDDVEAGRSPSAGNRRRAASAFVADSGALCVRSARWDAASPSDVVYLDRRGAGDANLPGGTARPACGRARPGAPGKPR